MVMVAGESTQAKLDYDKVATFDAYSGGVLQVLAAVAEEQALVAVPTGSCCGSIPLILDMCSTFHDTVEGLGAFRPLAVAEPPPKQALNRRARRAAAQAAESAAQTEVCSSRSCAGCIREDLVKQRCGLSDLRLAAGLNIKESHDLLASSRAVPSHDKLQLDRKFADYNRAHHRHLAQLDRQLADCDGHLAVLDEHLVESGAWGPALCRGGRLALVRAKVLEAAN